MMNEWTWLVENQVCEGCCLQKVTSIALHIYSFWLYKKTLLKNIFIWLDFIYIFFKFEFAPLLRVANNNNNKTLNQKSIMGGKKQKLPLILQNGKKTPADLKINLGEKEYTVIVQPRTGRFEGVFVKQPDGVYRCWASSVKEVDEQLQKLGYKKVSPGKCGLFVGI